MQFVQRYAIANSLYHEFILFQLKKEHSLSREILKKVAPQESHLLNDPIFNVKIKFR